MLRKIVLSVLLVFGVCYVNGATFNEDCLAAHNEYRRLHGVPDLELDSAVTNYAQEWADHLAAKDIFEHRSNGQYGENLYMVWGTNPQANARAAVDAWYDEIRYYDWNNPGFSAQTGHFTQVVWKNSKKLGCAFARVGNKVITVANYDPWGNYYGQFAENVPQLI